MRGRCTDMLFILPVSRLEKKIVWLSLAVNDPARLEVEVLELVQTAQFGSLGVKALPA